MREISSKMPCCFAHVGVSTSLASTSLVGARVTENEKKGGGVNGFRSDSLLWEKRCCSMQLISLFIAYFMMFL